MARLVARAIGETHKRTVLVENKPGASGAVGTREVARAEPDGATLVLGTNQTHVTNAVLVKEPGYDPQLDFVAVAGLAGLQHALVVPKSSQAASVRDLIASARAKPGVLNYGSTGAGSASHLAMELFMARAGIAMTHVPFRGAAPMAIEILAGRIDAGFATLPSVLGQIEAGEIKALALASRQSAPQLPGLPLAVGHGVTGADAVHGSPCSRRAPPRDPSSRSCPATSSRSSAGRTSLRPHLSSAWPPIRGTLGPSQPFGPARPASGSTWSRPPHCLQADPDRSSLSTASLAVPVELVHVRDTPERCTGTAMEIDPPAPSPAAATAPPEVPLATIFWIFFQIGALSIGGGLTAWLYREIVDKRRLMSGADFIGALTLASLAGHQHDQPLRLRRPAPARCRRRAGRHVRAAAGAVLRDHRHRLGLRAIEVLPGIAPFPRRMAAVAVGLLLSMGIKSVKVTNMKRAQLVIMAIVAITVGLLRWPMVPVILVMAPISVALAWQDVRRAADAGGKDATDA